jgi:hypothetical protein
MISSSFTELLMNAGVDGVLYPSVQAFGEGLCVAIRPLSMHKIKLVKVLQCKIEKKGNKVDILNLKYCDNPGETNFILKEV